MMIQSNWFLRRGRVWFLYSEQLARHGRFGTCPSKLSRLFLLVRWDRGIHPSPSPPACCIPVSQAPLLSLGSILTYDPVKNNTY